MKHVYRFPRGKKSTFFTLNCKHHVTVSIVVNVYEIQQIFKVKTVVFLAEEPRTQRIKSEDASRYLESRGQFWVAVSHWKQLPDNAYHIDTHVRIHRYFASPPPQISKLISLEIADRDNVRYLTHSPFNPG